MSLRRIVARLFYYVRRARGSTCWSTMPPDRRADRRLRGYRDGRLAGHHRHLPDRHLPLRPSRLPMLKVGRRRRDRQSLLGRWRFGYAVRTPYSAAKWAASASPRVSAKELGPPISESTPSCRHYRRSANDGGHRRRATSRRFLREMEKTYSTLILSRWRA